MQVADKKACHVALWRRHQQAPGRHLTLLEAPVHILTLIGFDTGVVDLGAPLTQLLAKVLAHLSGLTSIRAST